MRGGAGDVEVPLGGCCCEAGGFPLGAGCCGAEPVPVAACTVALPAAGAPDVVAVDVAGVATWWCAGTPGVVEGDDTTTFSGGGGGPLEREPIEGRRTVPESRSRPIAPAPRSSANTGSATRRAAAHTAPHLPFSLADTGHSPFPPLSRIRT